MLKRENDRKHLNFDQYPCSLINSNGDALTLMKFYSFFNKLCQVYILEHDTSWTENATTPFVARRYRILEKIECFN